MRDAPLKIILDCDTANEIDDQFAIAYALGSPALDLLGVVSVHNTTVHGDQSRDRYQAEAERVVSLAGVSVPCIPGAAAPMAAPGVSVASPGRDFLIDTARRAPVTIVATGPATDVASAIAAAPDIVEHVRVVWLGGFPDPAHYARYRRVELNGRADIAAWRGLWRSNVDLLHVPGWPGPARLTVAPEAYASDLRSMKRPLAAYLAEILVDWAGEHADMNEAKVLWDVATIAALVQPASVRVVSRALPSIAVDGGHDWQAPVRPADTLIDLEAAPIFADLNRALARLADK